jgi:hypothetical protein
VCVMMGRGRKGVRVVGFIFHMKFRLGFLNVAHKT